MKFKMRLTFHSLYSFQMTAIAVIDDYSMFSDAKQFWPYKRADILPFH